jgi:glucosamine 6-phosphate synthetase-like amidotransferase/phosphosugar isomerase protein
MEKEIYEQPDALGNTINGRLGENDVLDNILVWDRVMHSRK